MFFVIDSETNLSLSLLIRPDNTLFCEQPVTCHLSIREGSNFDTDLSDSSSCSRKRRTYKRFKINMLSTRTQMSWSKIKPTKLKCALSENSDQPEHPPSLIRVPFMGSKGPKDSPGKQPRLIRLDLCPG